MAIPCLDEAGTIADLVRQVPRQIDGVDRVDVLVVDDGSADDTARLAREAGATVIRHPVNRGVGAAFRTAVQHAVEHRYDLLVNLDGDGQFDPRDIPRLLGPIAGGEADMVTASRFLDPALVPPMPRLKRLGNRLMSSLVSRMVQRRFADVSCGFRAYSREALLRLNPHGAFTYTQEVFLDFAAKRMAIREVPLRVAYFPDRASRVAGSLARYGLNTFKILFRGYRDYFPLRFFWGLALLLAVPATALAALFLHHFWTTGNFTGALYAGFISAFLYMLAFAFGVVGVLADMLDRIRSNQERILYLLNRGR